MQTQRHSDNLSLTLHQGVIRMKTAMVCTSSEYVSGKPRVRERHGCFSCMLTHQMVDCRKGRFKVADAVKMGDQDGPESSACGYTGIFCFVSLVRMLVSTPLSFSFPFFCLLHQWSSQGRVSTVNPFLPKLPADSNWAKNINSAWWQATSIACIVKARLTGIKSKCGWCHLALVLAVHCMFTSSWQVKRFFFLMHSLLHTLKRMSKIWLIS